MRRLIIGVSLLSASLLSSETAGSKFVVHFEGRQNVSESLHRRAGIRTGESVSTKDLSPALERLYETLALDGWPLARLDTAVLGAGDPTRLTLYIEEGPVLTEASPEGAAGWRLTLDHLLAPGLVMLDSLLEAGFPFAVLTLKPGRMKVTADALLLEPDIDIERGPFMRIGEVAFTGTRHVKASLLEAVTRLKRGRILRVSDLERARRYLERQSFVASVGPEQIGNLSPGLARVTFPIVERRNGRIGGAVASAGGSAPTGDLDLSLGNLFGGGREIAFRSPRPVAGRSQARASWREVFIAGLPLEGRLEIEGLNDAVQGSARTTRITAGWEPQEGLILSAGVADRTIAGNGNSDRTRFVPMSITINRFDHDANPGSGWRGSIGSTPGFRRITGRSSRLRTGREDVQLEAVQGLTPRWALYGKVAESDVTGDGIAWFDLLRIGGAETLRGYSDERFLVRGATRGQIELRWRPPDRTTFAGLFFDAARLHRLDPDFTVDRVWPYAGGISFVTGTASGRLKLDLALAAGEPLRRGRLHLSLETAF